MTQPTDRLLRQTLQRRAAAMPSSSCLDAETTAAFVDGTLPATERARVEAHVADCARCQAMLAALARVTPPTAAPAGWWRRHRVAWLVPLTAAATALIVWVTRPVTPPAQVAGPSAVTQSAPPANASPSVQSAPEESPSESFQSPAAAAGEQRPHLQARRSPVSGQAAPQPAPNVAPGTIAGNAPEVRAPAPAAEGRRERSTDATAAAPSSAAASPSPGAGAAREQPVPSIAEMVRTQTKDQSLARQAALPVGTIVSSDARTWWRLGEGGIVHHSTDGGETWRPQATGVSVTLAAGSSPAPDVCWLVGPQGTIVLSTDAGRSWRRLPFANGADLVSVQARDARTATVTTAGGQPFTTTDQGRSWR